MIARSLVLLALGGALSVAAEPAPRPYVYRVLEFEVVDGDTIRTELDLGFSIRFEASARLDGLDAPEQSTAAGQAVTRYVERWLSLQQTVLAESVARDKYAGRYVGRIHGDREVQQVFSEIQQAIEQAEAAA